MDRRLIEVIRETAAGRDGVHAPREPKSQLLRSQSVCSSEEASNDRGAKGRRKVEA